MAIKSVKNGLKQRKIGAKTPIKAYNLAILDDDSAEINMYGDVVMEAPRDWWTGERIAGQYIAADEFLEDLEEIKEKSNITIHINSGGGDLYAGLAIYNRLKAMKGHVTTINDGLAASAASLIFQAGDTRKMNPASNFMAHGAAGLMWGFYTVEDLETAVEQFKAHNRAIVNVYAEAMGVSQTEAKKLIKSETWLTGQEAIDRGLADELVKEEEEKEEEGLLNTLMKRVYGTYPTNSMVPAAASQVENKKEEEEEMVKNVEELRAQYPEFVAQIENEAAENAKAQERTRIQGIEEIAGAITDKTMLENAKFGDNPLTVEEVSVAAMKQQAKIGAAALDALEGDTNASGVASIKADPRNAEGNKKEEEDDDDEKKEEKEAEDAVNFFNKHFNRR